MNLVQPRITQRNASRGRGRIVARIRQIKRRRNVENAWAVIELKIVGGVMCVPARIDMDPLKIRRGASREFVSIL